MSRYRPKPWPPCANRHRQAAIDEAGEIRANLREAQQAIRERNLDLAVVLVALADTKAGVIISTLENAPSSEAGPEGGE